MHSVRIQRIKARYRDDCSVHLMVKVPNFAHGYATQSDETIYAIEWLNQNASGWELCYLSSRSVTFQVDEFPEDDAEVCIRFQTAEQATLFRMFFG